MNPTSSRRRFLKILLTLPVALGAALRLGRPAPLFAAGPPVAAKKSAAKTPPAEAPFAATPECGDDDEPTPRETMGPFYKPRSPRRTSLLESGIEGTKVVLVGRVYSRDCRPLAGVLVDFWHADDAGDYDNDGFKLRGHQFTDEKGRYRLETIVPGLYPGRTRHYHVRLQAPNQRPLATQLYFPDEPRNRNDFLFRPDLLMSVKDAAGAKQARFHFKLDVA